MNHDDSKTARRTDGFEPTNRDIPRCVVPPARHNDCPEILFEDVQRRRWPYESDPGLGRWSARSADGSPPIGIARRMPACANGEDRGNVDIRRSLRGTPPC